MTLPRILLLPKRARPFYGRHPWVYPAAIASVQGDPADGDVVDLISDAGAFVARGLYNSRSKIRVRLYAWHAAQNLDAAFFKEQLRQAIHLRSNILGRNRPGQASRLVYSESDGLSGLTVDRYDRWLCVQFTSLGLARRRELFAELLTELLQPEGIYLRTEREIGRLEGVELEDGLLCGRVPDEPVTIVEDGIRFQVHLTQGQKTGFYLDQHDNRLAVARLAANRRVLDAFCYTGGFGLHAARAGATSVVGVDKSEPALALGRENAAQNGLANMSFERADVFDFLDMSHAAGQKFGLIVLDPPKFARNRNALDDALRGYKRLQSQALRLLEPNGVLVMCCCSGLVPPDVLEDLLSQISVAACRPIQLLERRGQSADHPVSVTCPETSYLKCLICRVV